jgi:hypothetical protein
VGKFQQWDLILVKVDVHRILRRILLCLSARGFFKMEGISGKFGNNVKKINTSIGFA